MNRKATKEEIANEKKGIERNKELLEIAEESLEVLNRQVKFLKLKREHENFLRPHNRKQEDKEIDFAIQKSMADIRLTKNNIKLAEKNIKEGYEVKNSAVGIE